MDKREPRGTKQSGGNQGRGQAASSRKAWAFSLGTLCSVLLPLLRRHRQARHALPFPLDGEGSER
jgi:hypothetical protein